VFFLDTITHLVVCLRYCIFIISWRLEFEAMANRDSIGCSESSCFFICAFESICPLVTWIDYQTAEWSHYPITSPRDHWTLGKDFIKRLACGDGRSLSAPRLTPVNDAYRSLFIHCSSVNDLSEPKVNMRLKNGNRSRRSLQ